MKKSLFIAALATLALASCSKNEVIELQQDQIKFSAVADNASRGTVVTTNTLDKFYAWGWAGETLYFNNAQFNQQSDNSFISKPAYWWPAQNMKFYATNLENVDLTNSIDYTVSTTLNDQKDFLYAAMFNQSKKDVVELNFRHALSQIVFQVGLDASKDNNGDLISRPITVDISRITLSKIKNKATFTMPTANTNTPNYSEKENGGEGDKEGKTEDHQTNAASWGKWDAHQGEENYSTNLAAAQTIQNRDNITTTTFAGGSYLNYGTPTDAMMLLLPQELKGATLTVTCDIKTDGAKDGETITLHTGDLTYNFADDAKWMQGKKYVYKLKFGATLQAIKFSVTVDVFQTHTGADIDFK